MAADEAYADWDEATRRHQQTLPHAARKQRGAWFTPMELARPTAQRALAGLPRDARICDPAVGGGGFLLAALPFAPDATLTGVDIDPDAVRIAREMLTKHATRVDVRTGDGLLELPNESFDCVLTNPPWETLQSGAGAKERIARLRPHFRHQGRGKLYTYRLFLERAVQLLRPGGRLGMIVPASLWFDREAEPLRRLLLDECEWQWLFGFENRKRVFDIDSRYRFGAIIATKGGRTKRVHVAFGRVDVGEWATRKPRTVSYERDELRALSPRSGAFVEVEHRRDLEILSRMHADARPLIGDGGACVWRQGDFNMTSHRDQFLERERAEADGYVHDGSGCFRAEGRPDLLPLIQGAMIYDLQGNAGAHESGTRHKTRSRRPQSPDELRPLYLVDAENWRRGREPRPVARIALRALSNATNERTAIACLLPDVPCGNSLGVMSMQAVTTTPLRDLAATCALLGSLAFDWSLRMRMGGTNLNGFVLGDCVLPRIDDATADELARLALQQCATAPWHEELWQLARAEGWAANARPCHDEQARRANATAIDALAGRAFSLRSDDVRWITRECDDGDHTFAKGFWRVERDLPTAERRPNRWRDAGSASPHA